MKVLGLVHQYIPHRCAGAESHIHSMLRALARRGHQVDVVLSDQRGEPYDVDGVQVRPARNPKADHVPYLAEADVIVTHLNNTHRAMILGEWNDVPVVVVQHNTFHQSKHALLLARARVDLVAVNSRWMGEDLTDFYIANETLQPPTVVVRPVADPVEYSTRPGGMVTLVNLRRRASGPKARDELSKGGELFRALAERLPGVGFLGVTGAYGVQQDLDGLPNVQVIGHVPHHRMRDEVYARTRILLVPSSYESWGRVASEAMCSGIPVIAHPTPGLQECLSGAGTFIDRDDVDGWVDAILSLEIQPGVWEEHSQRSRARADELAALDDLEAWCTAVETAATGVYHPERRMAFL